MPLRSVNQLHSYTFREDAFDVRGWKTRTMGDDVAVGRVHDILIDEQDRPCYLDIDLGVFRKHVLLPVGHATVDGRDDVVWVTGMSKEQLEGIPAYEHDYDRVPDEAGPDA